MARSSNSPIDPSKKKQSTRYHGNDNQTQMVLGWLFGENNRQALDNLHYVRNAPGDTHTEQRTTIFQSIKSYIFPKGLTHDFDPKIQIFLYLFLVKIRPRIVLDDAVDKKMLFRL